MTGSRAVSASRTLAAATVAALLASAVEANQPQSELDALDLERKMRAALEPSLSSTRKLEIIVSNSSGAPIRQLAYQARVTAEDGTRKLLTILSQPDSVRGTAILVTQTGEQAARKWIYSPGVRRVIELTPPGGDHSFLNTDFPYAAFGFVAIAERSIDTSEPSMGMRVQRKLVQTPEQPSPYSRIVATLSDDTTLPFQRNYYDRRGELWKQEMFLLIEHVAGFPTPMRIQMKNVQSNRSTEIRISDVRYNVQLARALFDPGQLPQAVTAPIWSE